MTIKEFGSTVRNHINDGLKGTIPDTSYSPDQLINEGFLWRNRLMYEMSTQVKIDIKFFYNTIDSVPIEEMDLSLNPVIKSGMCRSYVKIPRIFTVHNVDPIEFLSIGPVSKEKSFKIYYDKKFKHHDYRFMTSKSPYAFVDTSITSKNYIYAYLFNISKFKDIRYLTIRALFENPSKLPNDDCCLELENQEFPAPGWMQEMIIEKLTYQYINQYRNMNIPNFNIQNTDLKG